MTARPGTIARTMASFPQTFDHFLVLNKPLHLSSAAALNRLKRTLPRGTKLGHAGTLDPLATGVLVALLGRATKQSDRVMGLGKTYEATITLGARSETDDAEGPITPDETPPTSSSRDDVLATLTKFVGHIEQLPPAFSALKVGGRRACDRVRDGQTVELKPRVIRIDAIDLLELDWPTVRIRVDCGKGTYIRSLARDIGVALGTNGYLSGLVRSRVGPFDLAKSVDPDAGVEAIVEKLIPVSAIG
ncbi:MAG: tRNA pseudouridine(55) synthase TruB [Tepidisphaeraceae bacterium]